MSRNLLQVRSTAVGTKSASAATWTAGITASSSAAYATPLTTHLQHVPRAGDKSVASIARGNLRSDESGSQRRYGGAAELFGTSFEQHAQHMAAWVSQPLRNQSQRPVNDPMQTEIFLRELLDGAGVAVHQLPFHRTDVRAVADGKGGRESSPEFCVESHYWSCASNHTGLTKCAVGQEERQR